MRNIYYSINIYYRRTEFFGEGIPGIKLYKGCDKKKGAKGSSSNISITKSLNEQMK